MGLAARHHHRRRQVAGDVERGAAHVEEAIDAEDHADALGGNADEAEDHHHHRDRARRHAGGADAAEHADEHHRDLLREAELDAVELGEEQHGHALEQRGAVLVRGRAEGEHEAADVRTAA